jgi:hypothetical protein
MGSMMARYYFNLFNDETTFDEEGQELSGTEAARARAIREARVLAADSVGKGHLNLSDRVEVVDEAGALVLTVTFADAIAVHDTR